MAGWKKPRQKGKIVYVVSEEKVEDHLPERLSFCILEYYLILI